VERSRYAADRAMFLRVGFDPGVGGFLRVAAELPARTKKFDEISRSSDKSEQQ
jgi:hypothetical protein